MGCLRQNELIRLSKSCLSDEEKLAVMGVLDREFLGMGAEVQQFEKSLADFIGRPVVCVANGTAALQLALQAAGIGPGDEVLVQSLTYVASFQAISATGAKPVACDIHPETLTLNCRDAEGRVTSQTKAVMPVHYSGDVGDLEATYDFARRYGLRVVEDAAHAFGSTHQGKIIGSFGDIACFSFDGIKNITSGEGGCVVTNDAHILRRVRNTRLLSVEKDTEKRFAGLRSWEFDVCTQGWRYHMSNIMAAIGVEQLRRFPELAAKRQKLARLYDMLLVGNSRISIFKHDYDAVVPHIYVVRVNGLTCRESLREKLLTCGIQTGIHYQPNHRVTFYKTEGVRPLPVTDLLFPELLSLPLHPSLSEDDIAYVCRTLFDLIQSEPCGK